MWFWTLTVFRYLSWTRRFCFCPYSIRYTVNYISSVLDCRIAEWSTKAGHWVCIYVDSLGRGEYFDSYGREPLKQVENLFKKNNIINYTYNGTPLQAVGSIVCGQYCLYYLTRRILCDESLYSIVKKLLGVHGPFIRDNYVNEYVRKYYKIVQTAYTVHVFIQLCKPFIM